MSQTLNLERVTIIQAKLIWTVLRAVQPPAKRKYTGCSDILLTVFQNVFQFSDRDATCDFFFWTGEDGIFGVESTKNKCRMAAFTSEKTFLDIKLSMTPQDGSVSGFQGCSTEIEA